MWRIVGALLLISSASFAQQPVLRFSVAESWTMPLIRVEQEQPVEGILHELMLAVAREVGHHPEFHVLPRLRLQQAMDNGDVDVRCYVAQSWLNTTSDAYLWSLPLFQQRDWLVGQPDQTPPLMPTQLAPQAIGTVLGYTYSTIEPLFASGRLHREDSRNQLLVLNKLHARRYHYAISNQLSLDWFNRQLPSEQQLRPLAVVEEQTLACLVRNDPALPVQGILQALLRLKASGEIERMIERYTHIHGQPPQTSSPPPS
ncbi:ABC transporter substrate-binding protein [Pseudomonas vranovensis]|uniref:Amino acid ABC transporter substrate-binding protein n=1 Tax=Pseudomonas vranovensis TaxID=321661 RepID=A0A423CUG3_9PSED|nr:transporter substrate-binding domain-containing protein [Pseudomonas vranovensis]ROL62941.1 amino acid ABC transporter substrate-binding protein [Pseudomonas vranovensis]